MNGSYHIENDFGNYTFTITDGQPTDVEMSLASGTTYSGTMSDGKLSGQAQINIVMEISIMEMLLMDKSQVREHINGQVAHRMRESGLRIR